jgi:hypothetical protein
MNQRTSSLPGTKKQASVDQGQEHSLECRFALGGLPQRNGGNEQRGEWNALDDERMSNGILWAN